MHEVPEPGPCPQPRGRSPRRAELRGAGPPGGPRPVWLRASRPCSTWPNLRREFDHIHVGTFTGPADPFRQSTELTEPQPAILKALEIDAPPRIYQLKPVVEA